jgi:putative ATPase
MMVGTMSDLFSAAAEQHLKSRAPLAARLRPRSIDEVVGQQHLVGEGASLRLLVETDRLTSALFWGPPGTGKTSLALAVAGSTKRAFVQLSAVTAGVADVRGVIQQARQRLGEHQQGTILFLDEIHRFSKSQQDALLPAVEDGTITLVGATTENPFFEVNAPLRSRSTLFRLEPLERSDIRELVRRGLRAEAMTADDDATELLIERAGGDGRQVLTALEVACALATKTDHVTLDHVESALGTSALRYGRDDHYDVVSAFIKSMRGSDPNAAVYWLARMLSAGEDVRFVARRMVIFASEDIGMADAQALTVAVSAASAVDVVGMPEAQLNLAEAAIYLASAPKGHSVARAIWSAMADVQAGVVGEVPAHLRDAHYSGAADIGHGAGYVSPHDDPSLQLEYLPDTLSDRRWYRPDQDSGGRKDANS